MDETTTTRRRRFTGRPGIGRARGTDFDYLAEVLLSRGRAEDGRPAPDGPHPAAAPGLYVLDAGGLDPPLRRRSALAAAVHLAPRAQSAALFVFHDARADAHVVGEPPCGRLGPQSCPGAETIEEAVDGLMRGCEQVGVILLDGLGDGLGPMGKAAHRVVFLATSDAESLVETYRRVKRWHAAGSDAEAGLLLVGGPGGTDPGPAYARLRRAAREFLGTDLVLVGCVSADGPGGSSPAPEWRSIFAEAPAAAVWPRLLAAGERADRTPARRPDPPLPAARGPAALAPDAGAVLQVWRPAGQAALLDAVEAQVPLLLGPRFRTSLRIDVEEPGAPPLAGVRDDGALVAIVIQQDGGPVDTRAAETWLRVHRSLLVRAYPSAGISAEAAPAAMVLAPLEVPPPTDGRRRFLPVQCGGRKGVVLLP